MVIIVNFLMSQQMITIDIADIMDKQDHNMLPLRLTIQVFKHKVRIIFWGDEGAGKLSEGYVDAHKQATPPAVPVGYQLLPHFQTISQYPALMGPQNVSQGQLYSAVAGHL